MENLGGRSSSWYLTARHTRSKSEKACATWMPGHFSEQWERRKRRPRATFGDAQMNTAASLNIIASRQIRAQARQNMVGYKSDRYSGLRLQDSPIPAQQVCSTMTRCCHSLALDSKVELKVQLTNANTAASPTLTWGIRSPTAQLRNYINGQADTSRSTLTEACIVLEQTETSWISQLLRHQWEHFWTHEDGLEQSERTNWM